jgi:MFS family permease
MWVACIPGIKWRLGLSDQSLSTVLLAMACGAIAGMYVFPRISRRIGARATARALAVAVPLALVLPGVASDVGSLHGAGFLLGCSFGLLNVAMNLQAVTVQKLLVRPILGSCHALWSGANIIGTVCASLLIGAGWTTTAVLLASAVVLAPAAGVAGTRLIELDATQRGSRGKAGRLPKRVWLLGGLVLVTLLCEGAVADWAGVHLHGTLGAPMWVAALGYGAFSATSALGRLLTDRLLPVAGDRVLVRTGGFLAATGFLMVVFAPNPVIAVAGWAVAGFGLAGVLPLVYTVAGSGPHGESALAKVSALGYLGLVLGPVLIGTLARWVGLDHALAALVLVALLVAAAGPLVMRDRTDQLPEDRLWSTKG